MRFNLTNPLDVRQAKARLEYLIEKKAIAELTEKRGKRTLSQNNYFYLILTAWGLHLGYTLHEMKKMLKQDWMQDVFEYTKKGRVFYRSTADLNSKEMTSVIDNIRQTANDDTGLYLPEPNEQEMINAMQNYVDRYKE